MPLCCGVNETKARQYCIILQIPEINADLVVTRRRSLTMLQWRQQMNSCAKWNKLKHFMPFLCNQIGFNVLVDQ